MQQKKKNGLVWFYGISTILGYFNAKSSLYKYIKYVWFVNIFCW